MFCIASQTALSQTVTVTATNDVVDGTTTSIAALLAAPGADGKISLREAIMAINGEPSGANITITLPAATLVLSIAGTGETAGAPNAAIGDLDLLAPATGTKTVTINGTGLLSTIISQTTGTDRIIDAHPNSTIAGGGNITLNISGVKMTGGVASAPGSGGAILAGRANDVTTLTNCLFDLNSSPSNGGAISQSSSIVSHNLTITNCTFTNNSAGGAGGAVSYNGQGTALIMGSVFTNNMTTVAGGDGGALSTTGGGNGGTYTVEKNTFLNNQALNPTGHAGAVINGNGTLTLRYNRFIGNTCANISNPPLANIVAQTGGSNVNTTIADNNWWGVNTGPGTNDATALAAGGTMTLTKWLQLKTTASPNPICNTPAGLGNTTTVTTSFLSNSANEAIAVSNLSVLIGLPVTWSQTLGSLSSQQSSIQANGTATALFTSNGTGGTATVNARVDNVPLTETSPARANITVNTLPTVTAPTNTITCVGSTTTFTSTITGTPAPTINWRIGTTNLVDGLQGSGSTVSGAGTATLTITNAQTGDAVATYNVQASNHCGTANSTDATLTVNIPSVAPTSITGTSTLCNPASTTLTAVGGTLGTNANYQWGTGAVVGTNSIVGATNSTFTTPTLTSTITYWVQIENTAAPCTINTGGPTQVVTVNQPSSAPTGISGTTIICSGSPTTLTATGGTLGTGANYQWGTGPVVGSSPISGETSSTLIISPTSNTTYWVQIVNTASPCTATTGGVTQLVTVNNPSFAPVEITGTTTICNGSSTTLTARGGILGTGANYQWGTGSVVGTSPLAGGETSSTITVSPTSHTTYWVRIVNTTAPCTANTGGTTQLVTVNQLSVAPSGATGSTAICNGGNTTLTVAGGTKGTGATTEWFTGSCGGTSAGTGDAITVSPTTTTTYFVRYNGTCNTTTCAEVIVTVNQPVNAGVNGNTSVCDNSTSPINLFGLISGEQAGGVWSRLTGTGGTLVAVSGTFTPAAGATTSTFQYLITGTPPCPTNVSVATVFITPQANAGTDGNTSVCDYSIAAINLYSLITGEQAGGAWSRLTGTGGTFVAASGTFTPAAGAATSTFQYLITGVSPCSNDESVATVNISAQANAGTDGGTGLVCDNSPSAVNLFGLITGEQAGGVWSRLTGTGGTFNAGAGTYTPATGATTSTFQYLITGTSPCPNDASSATVNIISCCVPPTITCPGNQTVSNTPGSCSAAVTYISSVTGTAPTITYVFTGATTGSGSGNGSGSSFNVGITTVTLTATNACGAPTCSFTVKVNDVSPPVISGVSVNPVSLWPPNHTMRDVTVNYTSTDICGSTSTCTLSVSSNEPVNGTGDGDTAPDWEIVDGHHVKLRAERAGNGNGRIYTITITCTDAAGNSSTASTTITVAHNITGPVSGNSFKVGSTVNFSGVFWDKPGNKHTGKWLIDGSALATATITEPVGNQNGRSTGSYKFNTPGVYKLQMNITDQTDVTSYANTNGDLEAIVVIYDPNGGYTYGGGWYQSQAGAVVSNPTATGKASYGFTVNYYKNATNPKGESQFEFKVGTFEFNALNFDYLVIQGAKGQFRGTGKITGGQSGVGFIMTVIDGALDGSGVDKVRMKIYNKTTNAIYYDNQPGSDAANPVTPVGTNSSIVIGGTAGNNPATITSAKVVPEELPVEGLEISVHPNPTSTNYTIVVNAANKKDRIMLQVFDVSGKMVEVRNNISAGSAFRLGDKYRPGSYFIRVMQGKEHKEMKLIKLTD